MSTDSIYKVLSKLNTTESEPKFYNVNSVSSWYGSDV